MWTSLFAIAVALSLCLCVAAITCEAERGNDRMKMS
jgi:hypothetical protein